MKKLVTPRRRARTTPEVPFAYDDPALDPTSKQYATRKELRLQKDALVNQFYDLLQRRGNDLSHRLDTIWNRLDQHNDRLKLIEDAVGKGSGKGVGSRQTRKSRKRTKSRRRTH